MIEGTFVTCPMGVVGCGMALSTISSDPGARDRVFALTRGPILNVFPRWRATPEEGPRRGLVIVEGSVR
jgi:hypothetical protein